MMKRLYALKCQCGEIESSVIVKKETIPVRGENIEIESNIRVCNNCGEELFDEELEEDNLSRAYEEYRKKKDILLLNNISKSGKLG